MLEFLCRLSGFFPSLGVPGAYASLFHETDAEPGRYASMSLALSAAGASALLPLLWVLRLPQEAAAIAFLAAVSILLSIPALERSRREREIEAAMPHFLRELGMLLGMGIPFERAVRMASDGEGALGRGMDGVSRGIESGMSVQKSLSRFASDYPSLAVKKAIAQMMAAYESGEAREMGRMGDELLSQERHRLREYASKSGLFGLLFLVASAVLPTFYLVFAIAGEAGLGGAGGDPALLMLAAFPAAGALMLLLSSAMLPPSAFGDGRGGGMMMIAAAGLSAATLAFPHAWAFFVGALMALFIYMAHRSIGRERRLEAIGERLPDALLCASGMPRSSPPERVFGMMEDGGFGPLSEEAARSRRQIEAGLCAKAAFADFASRCPAPIVKRASRMMAHMADTASFDRMSGLASDMIAFHRAMRERKEALSMQRYTLMLGALIIPAILGMALSLAGSMADFTGDGAGSAPAQGAAALIPPYLAIYSVMSAGAIADAEGRESSGPPYAFALCALSLLAFKFISL